MTLTNEAPAEASLTRPWPADQLERWPIERLIPYANNPRLHSEADLDKIAASILKWGWTNPPLVDEDGTLIGAAVPELTRTCQMGPRVRIRFPPPQSDKNLTDNPIYRILVI